MPTNLARIQVSVDESLAAVIAIERKRQPSASDSAIVRDLCIAEAARRSRKQAFIRLANMRLAYPENYLDELRGEWPQ